MTNQQSLPGVAIHWFRKDLRLADNDSLFEASRYSKILPIFILDEEASNDWPLGGASRWWLHRSLCALQSSLRQLGSDLLVLTGDSHRIIDELVTKYNVSAVFWNRRYESFHVDLDTKIKASQTSKGVVVKSFNGHLLHEPWTILKGDGTPYKVYTPYWRASLKVPLEPSRPNLKILPPLPDQRFESIPISDLGLNPTIPWDTHFHGHWQPGEIGAQKVVQNFLRDAIAGYEDQRNLPSVVGTSSLSPHLAFGEISVKSLWRRLTSEFGPAEIMTEKGVLVFLKELVWREFAYHLLFHFPHTSKLPMRPEFESFPWAEDRDSLQVWQQGLTGYPIVDAGMRQLWQVGWMHNRVRMIVASFLVKDLLVPWQKGAAWFWDTLVDADLSSNSMGWQWVAGCGADAAPYFRVFNPYLQGEKFDGDGLYVKRWCPELQHLPAKWVHRPGDAPAEVLKKAGIQLGKDYPLPIVDHQAAKMRALQAYEAIKGKFNHLPRLTDK